MYDLFELTKVLSYTEPYTLHSEQLKLKCHAFQSTTDRSLLCLNFSTGKLFLWQKEFGHDPKHCWLPWYPQQHVEHMTIDPTGSWLMALSSDVHHITIVPARSILDPLASVDQLWQLDDVTEIHLPHRINGRVDCLTWWKTMCGDNVAILGTKVGFLVFVDLVEQREVLRLDLNEHIVDIQVLHSDSFTSSYALVSTKSGSHWFLLLEEKLEIDLSIIRDSSYFSIQDQYRTIYRLHPADHGREDPAHSKFQPRRSSLFPPHVQLTAQYAKGRHFIAAHDLSNSTYQMYSIEVGQGPLFAYKLPLEADEVLYTDKLMFASHSQGGATLNVIANQLSEVSGKQSEGSKVVSVIQSFHLDPGESIHCINRKCFPFYWHNSQQEVTSEPCDVHIRTHSVFDGCLVVSSRAVYECRPRISPERLFVRLCASNVRLSRLEALSVLLGLDVCHLTIQVAQGKLRAGERLQAERLLNWAKVSPLQRCLLYAQYGQVVAALSLCESLLEGHAGQAALSSCDRRQVALVSIQLLVTNTLKSTHRQEVEAVRARLTRLLMRERRQLPADIWQMLCDSGLQGVAWAVARAVGEVSKVVEMYTQKRKLHVDTFSHTPLQDGAAAYWEKATLFHGSLLEHLTQTDLVHLLHSHPSLLSHLLDLLEDALTDLHLGELLKVAQVLDPAQDLMRWQLQQYFKYRERLDPSLSDRLVDMVMLFVLSVLHLNKQSASGHVITAAEQVTFSPASVDVEVVSTRPVLMSCSLHKTLIVMRNRLWGWGRGQHHGGPDTELDEVSFPAVKSLAVISVSCGYRHALALTTHGVYSWGSNSFGQLGHADGLSRSEPGRVARLHGEQVVEVSCGQYHSLALMENGRVYSWGWGVHGQLGHGNPDNMPVPTEIAALRGHMVVTIRGGQGHSVVLTKQGAVYCFGCNAFGQCGVGDAVKRSLPVRVRIEQPVHLIDTHYFHTVAVTTQNSLYHWGLSPLGLKQKLINAKKTRGLVAPSAGHANSHMFPRLGPSRNIKQAIVQVACGADMTVVVTATGEVYSWGRNSDGQLGIGRMVMKEQFPVPVTSLHGVCIQQVSCGPNFVLALDNTGRPWGWGRNDHGQLWHPQTGSSQSLELCIVPVRLPLQMEPPKLGHQQWKLEKLSSERIKLEGLSKVDGTAGPSVNQLKSYLYALSPFLNEHLLLRKSVQLGSHLCSAALCEHMAKHTEAFTHRLKALRSCDLQGAELTDVLAQTLGNVLKSLEGESGDRQYHLQSVLQQLLVFWGDRPPSVLETVLSTHLPLLVTALVIVIDRHAQSPTAPSVLFSPRFLMRVSLLLTSQMHTGALSPAALLTGLHSHLASNARTKPHHGGDTAASTEMRRERLWWACVERLEGGDGEGKSTDREDRGVEGGSTDTQSSGRQGTEGKAVENYSVESQRKGELTGESRDIHGRGSEGERPDTQNTESTGGQGTEGKVIEGVSKENQRNRELTKDTEIIKKSQHGTDNSKPETSENINTKEERRLLFTCGHEVTRSEFKVVLEDERYGVVEDEVIAREPGMNQTISSLDTSQVVTSYYRNPSGTGKLACPSCLYRVISGQRHKHR